MIAVTECSHMSLFLGVISLDNYDITNDGVIDLLVGRDDGLVEIYGYDEMDEPVLKHSVVRLMYIDRIRDHENPKTLQRIKYHM